MMRNKFVSVRACDFQTTLFRDSFPELSKRISTWATWPQTIFVREQFVMSHTWPALFGRDLAQGGPHTVWDTTHHP